MASSSSSNPPVPEAVAPVPSSRKDFNIAILCALPLEFDAVEALLGRRDLDKFKDPHERDIQYETGDFGIHNVVVVQLAGAGGKRAANATGLIKKLFPRIQWALVVGVCGGIPFRPPDHRGREAETLLGDVIVSQAIIELDYGRDTASGFRRKKSVTEVHGRPNEGLTGILAALGRLRVAKEVREQMMANLKELQKVEDLQAHAPDAAQDFVFEASYVHPSGEPDCKNCDPKKKISRERLGPGADRSPQFHLGIIGTFNSIEQNGVNRDMYAKSLNIIAFEQEGTGPWGIWPCVVIKGVCDYADSHKSKNCQRYAAATAAAFAKAFVARLPIPEDYETIHHAHTFLWAVPFNRNRDFKGRGKILDRLLDVIPPSADKDACQRVVLEGLGGIGKTQIALEAAFRLRERHQTCSVFWVPAVDATTFENAYRQIGQKLGVQGIDEDNANVKHLVKAALDREDAGSWLLIIDNVDDEKLLFGHVRLCDHLPSSRKGSILFTTRNHQVAVNLTQPGARIEVPKMDQDEAVKMLQACLQDKSLQGTCDDMTNLLEFLCSLPLAIKQAAAYMAMKKVTTIRYLRHCRESDQKLTKLLSNGFEDQGCYDATQNPVATTWLVSFKHIQKNCPLAAKYLRFICFLTEKDIFRALLPAADELDADDALGELKAYAFITQRERGDSFDLHRLVRLAMRNWVKGEEKWVEGVTEVIQRLTVAVPFPEQENRNLWLRYLPHAQIALESQQACTDEMATLDLLSIVGRSNNILGKYAEAETMHRQELQLYKKVLGDEHPSTVTSMNNLAFVLSRQGKYAEAETMHRLALQLRKKVLGNEHPDTVTSISNLANVLSDQGKHAEAETMHRQALQLYEKVLGDEHPFMVASISNLANVLSDQGKHAEAETMHRQALQLNKKVLGDEHPDTVTSMNNLANMLSDQGKYAEAEMMHRLALQLNKKVLGDEHPDTVTSISNLANVLSHQGKHVEAKTMYRKALQLYKKVLGDEHPDTVTSISNLANMLSRQGKYAEAETMHRQALQLYKKVLDNEHPSMVASISNLANVLSDQGKHAEAETMHRQALQLNKKVLGDEHPDTVTSISNLANVLSDQGKHAEAETMHRQALQLFKKMLGDEHPDTVTSMNNLAIVLSDQGKHAEAKMMYRQALQLYKKVLGDEHPSTVTSMNNLANVLSRQGKHAEAETMHRQALQLRKKVLGDEHPDTVTSISNLANVLFRQGKHAEAETMHRQALQLRKKVLGDEHPDTVTSISNLANVLSRQGKHAEAETMHRKALQLRKKVLGDEHPDTVTSMNNFVNEETVEQPQTARDFLAAEEPLLHPERKRVRRWMRRLQAAIRK